MCFGRLDTDGGDRLYIGRLGVSDETGEPLMVDWRAPVAEAFYRATSADRRGVVRRRHIRMKGRRAARVDDELLARKVNGAGRGLVGEAALLSSLEQARTGRMGDIVATIQAEQDAGHPGAVVGSSGSAGRPGHRQDGGGAAPGGLPPLRPPVPLGQPRGARSRSKPGVLPVRRRRVARLGGDGRAPVDAG